MLKRHHFRQHAPGAHVIPTRSSRLGGVLLTLIFVVAILSAYAIAAHGDERSDAGVEQAAALERKRMAMQPELLRAYEAGMADAMEAVNGKPEGMALAQACLVMRGGL